MATLTKRPIQIYLRQEQLEALRVLANKQGVSVAELVRQGVDRILSDIPLEQDPIWDIVGLGSSDVNDLSLEHDRYLAEIEDDNNRF
jgi:hypothetical protein